MKQVAVFENGRQIGTATVFVASTIENVLSWHADIALNGGERISGVPISVDPCEVRHITRKRGEYVAVSR